jgi:tetratricopeptide (TPR) repeat protein
MPRRGALTRFAGILGAALSLVLALPAVQARGQPVLDAACTGETDMPWSEQIAGCTRAIGSGKLAGKDLVRALMFRAKAYGQSGDLDRCLADVEEAIRLDPTNAFAVGARGDVYLVQKDYQRALAEYTKAAALDPGNALVLVGRGIVYVAIGDRDRAMGDFEQAIRLQPNLAIGLYWRGVVKRLNGDAAAGEADIAAAKKLDPKVEQ